jgi:hypothetical protein
VNYSKGITWFDDCRIPFVDEGWGIRKNSKDEKKHNDYGHNKLDQLQNDKGRFPSNLLVSDDMLNDTTKYYDIDKWFDKMIDEL